MHKDKSNVDKNRSGNIKRDAITTSRARVEFF